MIFAFLILFFNCKDVINKTLISSPGKYLLDNN